MPRPPLFPGEPPAVLLPLKPWGFTLSLPEQADALSEPALADLALMLAGLLPSGGAWRSPDNAAFNPEPAEGSRLGGFLRGLSGDFVTLYRRIFGIAIDSTASTVGDGLDDWEVEYGLPDPCLGPQAGRAERVRSLVAKVRSSGTITPADFTGLASALGYNITIEEPEPFTCGFSECSLGGDEMSAVNQYFWIVHITDTPETHFECGISECGIDYLLDFPLATALECVFRALAPAWTMPIFNYGD